jgi:hypothetical protein
MGTVAGGTGGSQALGGLASAASAVTPWATLGLGAVNIATDLVQASKQADAQKAAERAAQTAAREQERLLSQDFFSALQVPTEAYQRAARETTSQVGQAVGALQEGDSRLLAGGIGKVAAAGIEGEAATRDAMAQDLYKLDLAQAAAATNVNTKLADLEADRLAGAQQEVANAYDLRTKALQGAGATGIGILGQGLNMLSPFGMDKQPTGPNPNFQSKTGERFEGNPGASWQAAFTTPDTSKYSWSS